jgi:D-xylose transport system substrate-binding protein
MKHPLVLLVFVFFLLSSYSCSEKKIKIGLLLPNLVDERFQKDRDYFVAKIKQLGGETLIKDGNFNDMLQIEQAKELVKEGIKVLVIIPVNTNSAAAIVRIAKGKKIKTLAYERIISNCDLDYYVSFDNRRIGELMAETALKQKPEGDYYILGGDKGDKNAVSVREGILTKLDPEIKAGKVHVVFDRYTEDWSGENACSDLKQYLNLSMKVPDVIISAYNGMSNGAIKALEENNVTNFPLVTGQDADVPSCRKQLHRKQHITLFKSIKLEAESAADIVMKMAVSEHNISSKSSVFNGQTEVPALILEEMNVENSN